MTYNVSSGTLNFTAPYNTWVLIGGYLVLVFFEAYRWLLVLAGQAARQEATVIGRQNLSWDWPWAVLRRLVHKRLRTVNQARAGVAPSASVWTECRACGGWPGRLLCLHGVRHCVVRCSWWCVENRKSVRNCFYKNQTVQKSYVHSDGFPTETACNLQFKLKVSKNSFACIQCADEISKYCRKRF